MNTPPTAPPSGRQRLDQFEAALLGELKEHVATQPARATRPERPRRGKRVAVGIAAAAAVATAYVVVSPGGPAVSPAYAVAEEADGDVVVTVHRLEDANGLQAALREHGIDADVSFDPMANDHEFSFTAPDGGVDVGPPDGGTLERHSERGEGLQLSQKSEGGATQPEGEPDPGGCGAIDDGSPATLTHEGEDWVLRIPADSPLQDRSVSITTGAAGTLGVFYEGSSPGSYCGVMSVNH